MRVTNALGAIIALAMAGCAASGSTRAPVVNTSPIAQAPPTTEASPAESTPSGPSADEEAALQVAYPNGDTQDGLGTLREMCGESGAAHWDHGAPPAGFSAEQANEIKGMLMLCPDHPDVVLLRKYLALTERNTKLRAQGRLFDTGETYLVGKDIKPGTYVAWNAKDCYWERTDSSGNIIANHFSHGAARVQVTIKPKDYAFNSERCGGWGPP